MTGNEKTAIELLHTDIAGRLGELDDRLDHIERRLDRWDGAITFIKTAASFVGLGGLALFLAALARPPA